MLSLAAVPSAVALHHRTFHPAVYLLAAPLLLALVLTGLRVLAVVLSLALLLMLRVARLGTGRCCLRRNGSGNDERHRADNRLHLKFSGS